MMSAKSPKTPKLIVIVGFMGSGKTTIARELARVLNCRAIDLDELIGERERRTPAEIIEQSGEEVFRRIETETLYQVLSEQHAESETRIIALGGGAWTIPENRKLIDEREGLSVWLDTPFELCWQRIARSEEPRPLAQSSELAEKLFTKRRPVYALANIRIDVSEGQTASAVAVAIATHRKE